MKLLEFMEVNLCRSLLLYEAILVVENQVLQKPYRGNLAFGTAYRLTKKGGDNGVSLGKWM